jgi:hypothetical protein
MIVNIYYGFYLFPYSNQFIIINVVNFDVLFVHYLYYFQSFKVKEFNIFLHSLMKVNLFKNQKDL